MTAGKPSRDAAAARLVERQMRNWELARAQRHSVPAPQRKEVEDFIAVSRAVGAGGVEVAAQLGEALNWPVFDREILDVMAGDDEMRRQVYASMDERDMGWFEETISSLLQPEVVKNDYFHRLTETVLSLARQGHAVFLGRGADLILPQDIGFRVRLVAPRETCIANLARRRNLSRKEAEAQVARLERQRAEFTQHHFQIDAADQTRHDLIINTARFTPDQVVRLILSAHQAVGSSR